MASDAKDIEQEAILTAFITLNILAKKGEDANRLGAYFRVMFRTQCIRMAAGVVVSNFVDINQVAFIPYKQQPYELDHSSIQQALQQVSRRQRQISQWILDQPNPVNTTLIAQQFGVRERTVRAILFNAIRKIEETNFANTRIRKDISIAA
jgi:DNA-directed RNA polymerase specialized sigma24 family protein